jgi:hypothetical protein
MRATAIIVTLFAAVGLAACSSSGPSTPSSSATTSGSSAKATTTTTASHSSGNTGNTENTGNSGNSPGSPSCAVTSSEKQPSASEISTAVGLTLTGPTHTGGVAPCVYTTANQGQNPGGIEVNVLYNSPAGESEFNSQSASAVGGASNLESLPGVGKDAFYSTANNQDEVFVWVSSNVNFSVVVNTANDTPAPINLTQAEEVAKALAAG